MCNLKLAEKRKDRKIFNGQGRGLLYCFFKKGDIFLIPNRWIYMYMYLWNDKVLLDACLCFAFPSELFLQFLTPNIFCRENYSSFPLVKWHRAMGRITPQWPNTTQNGIEQLTNSFFLLLSLDHVRTVDQAKQRCHLEANRLMLCFSNSRVFSQHFRKNTVGAISGANIERCHWEFRCFSEGRSATPGIRDSRVMRKRKQSREEEGDVGRNREREE